MFNQEIKNLLINIIKKQQNNVEEIKERINYIENSFITLYNFFCDNNDINKNNVDTNLKMPLISLKGENEETEMKFQGKTIHRNKNCKTWYTRYRDENGKQHYISGKTQKEVLQELKSQLNYVKKEKKKVLTLQDWYNQWLELFKIGKVEETTLKTYRTIMKNVDQKLLNKDIKKITSLEIINNLEKIKFSRAKQTLYEFLKSIFSKALDLGLINKNIILAIDKPKHTKVHGTALTNQEQQQLINACMKEEYGDIFLITLYQGLRIGETLALTGQSINLETKELTINHSFKQSGKIGKTKNKSSERVIPIFDNTLPILEKYANYGNNRLFKISYNKPNEKLKTIINKINLRDISCHDLRHTFITNCQNKMIPEHIIQTWVGHEIGSKITSSVYTHTNKEDTLIYINKYNESLKNSTQILLKN